MLRGIAFFAALVLCAAAIVYGVSLVYVPAAWIVGGVLSAALAWLVFSE